MMSNNRFAYLACTFPCKSHRYEPSPVQGEGQEDGHTLSYSAACNLYSEHIGQIGLATAGNTSDEDIPVIRDVMLLPLAKCLCLWHYSSVTVALIWRALKQGKLPVKGIVACLFTENVLEIKAGMLQEV